MTSWIQIVLLMLLCISCAQKGPIRIQQPKIATRPPKIEAIVDLGGLPVLSPRGEVDKARSDGRFTPGEYVLISGQNLTDKRVHVFFGEQRSIVESFVENGLLVRLPRRISYLRSLPVAVVTPVGRATQEIKPQGYLILSDTSNGEIRFFRTEKIADKRHLLEPECDSVALPGARFHLLSGTGAFLYGIPQITSEDGGETPTKAITVIHLGAKDHPQEIASIPFSSNGKPTAVIPDAKRNRFLLLTTTELFVYTTEDEQRPKLKAAISLEGAGESASRYDRISLLKGGDYAVLQDSANNRLTLVHVSPRMPLRIVNDTVVTDNGSSRLIDLMTDSNRDEIVHVIEGPNLRGEDGETQILESDTAGMSSRLISFELKDESLHRVGEVSLGAGVIPLFAGYSVNGSKLISLVDMDVMRLKQADMSVQGIKEAAEILLNAVQLGRVIRIDNDGHVSNLAEETSLFLTLASPPDNHGITVVMMRIGVRKFPPSVGVKLSLVIMDEQGKHRDDHTLRNLSWQVLMPPYFAPLVTLQ